ncbi:MAG: hypothetical protein JW934_03165 [Anaerolineae bacterium]|nr:hypothetical protein [Anaerolineae bacterium]
MADTRVQLEAEDWVRREWMPTAFGQSFRRERLRLSSGGVFDFDAVSADNSIAATISTSGASTASGKNAAAKLQKIRADMLFLLLVKDVERRIVVLTEHDMYERCLKEKRDGRAPASIEFYHAELPAELVTRLQASRKSASKEVSRLHGQ